MNKVDWSEWYRRYPLAVWSAGALVAMVVIWSLASRLISGPAPMPGFGPNFQVVGFYENHTPGSPNPSSWPSLQKNWSSLSEVTPRWFVVNPTGSLTDIGYDSAAATFARQHHVPVVPLVNNAGGSSGVLWTAATRHRAAKALGALLNKDHFAGFNIDFELLKPSARSDLTRFVSDVRTAIGPHKILAVSVFPLVGLPASINGAYSYAGLAKSANYLVVMTYDHHYSGGPPGPVAPYAWVKANVAAALRQVPASKLVLAIGMYGYDWVNNGAPGPATSLSDTACQALAHAHGATIKYDGANSQNYFTYTSHGVSHIVWYMGDRSAEARAHLAWADHLRGIGLWRLGYENRRFWPYLKRARG